MQGQLKVEEFHKEILLWSPEIHVYQNYFTVLAVFKLQSESVVHMYGVYCIFCNNFEYARMMGWEDVVRKYEQSN